MKVLLIENEINMVEFIKEGLIENTVKLDIGDHIKVGLEMFYEKIFA